MGLDLRAPLDFIECNCLETFVDTVVVQLQLETIDLYATIF